MYSSYGSSPPPPGKEGQNLKVEYMPLICQDKYLLPVLRQLHPLRTDKGCRLSVIHRQKICHGALVFLNKKMYTSWKRTMVRSIDVSQFKPLYSQIFNEEFDLKNFEGLRHLDRLSTFLCITARTLLMWYAQGKGTV